MNGAEQGLEHDCHFSAALEQGEQTRCPLVAQIADVLLFAVDTAMIERYCEATEICVLDDETGE